MSQNGRGDRNFADESVGHRRRPGFIGSAGLLAVHIEGHSAADDDPFAFGASTHSSYAAQLTTFVLWSLRCCRSLQGLLTLTRILPTRWTGLSKHVCVDSADRPIAADPYYGCPTASRERRLGLHDPSGQPHCGTVRSAIPARMWGKRGQR